MPTLRVTFRYVVTEISNPLGGSFMPSDDPAIQKGSLGTIAFYHITESTWDSVNFDSVYEGEPGQRPVDISVWSASASEPTTYTNIPYTFTHVLGESTTTDFEIPDEALTVLRKCSFMNCSGSFSTGGALSDGSNYWFFSGTDVTAEMQIVGDEEPFVVYSQSSLVTNPYPEFYTNPHTFALTWGNIREVFWTQRVLCDEV